MKQRSSAHGYDLALLVADMKQMDAITAALGVTTLSAPCSIHDEHGTLLWMSDKAKNLLGFGEHNYLELVHVQDRVALAHFLAHAGAQNGAAFDFRPIISPSNTQTPKWVQVTLSSLCGKTTGSTFGLATYSDVTAQRQQAENHEHMVREAEQASSAKSKFLANISHELRTPLNAILGFSELLNSPLITSINEEKRGEYIGLIHDSASHLLTLLNGILDMSKIENGMYEIFPESFSLAKCLEKTTAIMQGQASKNAITLQTAGFGDMPDIVADERALKQIMINLLSNAIKFSNENGTVLVHAERRARTIVLSVIDHGVGISPEHLDNLGKPFFQADSKYDRKYEGTGLGLSVVKGLVELHGGTISFTSQRGKGTTAKVILPIYGKAGRKVPGNDAIEKVTSIRPRQGPVENDLRIIRNTA